MSGLEKSRKLRGLYNRLKLVIDDLKLRGAARKYVETLDSKGNIVLRKSMAALSRENYLWLDSPTIN